MVPSELKFWQRCRDAGPTNQDHPETEHTGHTCHLLNKTHPTVEWTARISCSEIKYWGQNKWIEARYKQLLIFFQKEIYLYVYHVAFVLIYQSNLPWFIRKSYDHCYFLQEKYNIRLNEPGLLLFQWLRQYVLVTIPWSWDIWRVFCAKTPQFLHGKRKGCPSISQTRTQWSMTHLKSGWCPWTACRGTQTRSPFPLR